MHQLAKACGIARNWRDVEGREQTVPDATLEAVLAALGHKSADDAAVRQGLAAIDEERRALPALVTGDAGGLLALPVKADTAVAVDELGTEIPLAISDGAITLPDAPGYYELVLGKETTRLAVAPARCPTLDPAARHAGISLQIPFLRGADERAFGNMLELAEAAETLGKQGVDALAISPVHALFPGDGQRFSPYSPSSRLHFNALTGDPALLGLGALPDEPFEELIDWQAAVPRRLKALRGVFDNLSPEKRDAILAGCDPAMEQQAVFDALYRHFSAKGARGWQEWPQRYRDANSTAVGKVARDNPDQVAFHLFLQWLARESLAKVQERAIGAGMAIGLIGDLAVGVDPGGSDCWALGDAMLQGLTVGAPPDPFSQDGQNWALTTFSPTGLVRTGFAPFIAMLRAGLGAGGGLRIDHAFGLSRLWVVPGGSGAKEGAYLSFPQDDLLRLVTLEAHRANAIIIAEDLGTAPHGFTQAIEARGMMGMQVLWFERAEDDGFIGAQDYAASSVTMSGTHDTPTLAGWWTGRDLDWAACLGRLPEGTDRAKAGEVRDWDRGLIWSTVAGQEERPHPSEPEAFITAALTHCCATASPLAVVPLEDVLAESEQPNLPGTVTEHPNWRRRMGAPLAEVLDDQSVQGRLSILNRHGT